MSSTGVTLPSSNSEAIRWFADQIPGSRYVEVAGTDSLPYVGEGTEAVLFMDIVGSTPLAESLGDRRWRDLRAGVHTGEVELDGHVLRGVAGEWQLFQARADRRTAAPSGADVSS